MRFADIFSGSGGLSYGFHKNGYSCVAAIDAWDKAVDSYNHNYRGNYARVADLYDEEQVSAIVKQLSNKVDILIGGPPCQGFSTLGKLADDCKKSMLVDIYFDIALRIKPMFIVMENVRGVMSKTHPLHGTYGQSIDKKIRTKYHYKTILINALEYGLAQTRVRFFLLAVRKDIDNGEHLLDEIVKNIGMAKKPSKVLKDIIGDLPRVEAGQGSQIRISKGRAIHNHQSMNHSAELQKRFAHIPPGGGLINVPIKLLTPHLKKMVAGKYGNGGHIKNIYGRLEWGKPCGTIIAGMDKITCGRYLHPKENRLLTPRECARIQSFPDDFIFHGSFVTQYYLIGNAVPPAVSQVLADAFKKCLSLKRAKAA